MWKWWFNIGTRIVASKWSASMTDAIGSWPQLTPYCDPSQWCTSQRVQQQQQQQWAAGGNLLTFQVQIIEVSRCGFVLWEKKLPNGGGFQAKIPASDGSTINKQHIISAWGSSGPRFALETNPHAQCSLVVHRPHHFSLFTGHQISLYFVHISQNKRGGLLR